VPAEGAHRLDLEDSVKCIILRVLKALNQTTGICDYERVEILLEVDSLRLSVHVEGEMCTIH